MLKEKFFISILFFAFGIISAVEFSIPMKLRSEAYLLRFFPRNERHFTEGMMDMSADMVSAKFSDNIDLTVFARSVIWTGMGYEWDDVVFDPRDMHYSLVTGFRSKLWNYYLTFHWLHDCFHEVDRNDEPTVIWNIFEFKFSPIDFFPDVRREQVRYISESSLILVPRFDWEIFWGFMPRLREVFWFQYEHPFSNRFGTNLRLGLLQYKNLTMEFEYRPRLWINYGGGTCQQQFFQFAAAYHSENGTMSFFWGYNAKETQPIRPTEGLGVWGLRWEF